VDERRALLRAILAEPDDDVRRLAFADWLDDNGTTDHDAARAEFIRLGCGMKNGRPPIQKFEREWLRANWQRLFPSVVAAAKQFGINERWKGRYLEASVLGEQGTNRGSWVVFEFRRGFAARTRFKKGIAYRRLRDAIAADDPVTTLGPYEPPVFHGSPNTGFVSILLIDWGQDVFDRLDGIDDDFYVTKEIRAKPPDLVGRKVQEAARNAIAAAMTAIAREANGLTPPPEPA
jgi:uncharacterized protein (TIGR02996 family)